MARASKPKRGKRGDESSEEDEDLSMENVKRRERVKRKKKTVIESEDEELSPKKKSPAKKKKLKSKDDRDEMLDRLQGFLEHYESAENVILDKNSSESDQWKARYDELYKARRKSSRFCLCLTQYDRS